VPLRLCGSCALWLICFVVGVHSAVAQTHAITFPTSDGWTIHADSYGGGDRAVILIHGGRFTKESWRKQIPDLLGAGFRVLAIDMRGFGASKEGPPALNTGFGSPLDALAAVRFLRTHGVKSVSIIGGSMGADAAAGASVASRPGEIDRVVLLAGSADEPAGQIKGQKLFIVARNDANAAGPRLPRIQKQYDAANQPKELLVFEGDAHAQFLFETDQGPRLMREVLRFLLTTER
jgi:pimeloyl-ACP methyl ester carboxylesterase